MSDPDPGAGTHPHDPPEDPTKDASGFQEDFLREVGEAVAAGFPPQDHTPEYLPEDQWAAVWDEVDQ